MCPLELKRDGLRNIEEETYYYAWYMQVRSGQGRVSMECLYKMLVKFT